MHDGSDEWREKENTKKNRPRIKSDRKARAVTERDDMSASRCSGSSTVLLRALSEFPPSLFQSGSCWVLASTSLLAASS